MSDKYFKRVKDLIYEGTMYNYDNFSFKSQAGYPSAIKQEYVAWKTKVESTILDLFGKSSPIYEIYKKHEEFKVLGNGERMFLSAHETILGSLTAALDLLNFNPEPSNDTSQPKNNKVFIVHGHDEVLKQQVEIFLTEIGLDPVVLHRQADEGLTIIEKFEKHSDVGFAFVLLTPDDIGFSAAEDQKDDHLRVKELRARQNVIFEFGYFVAKLGRNRVCCLYKEGVTIPTDVSGLLYKKISHNVEEAAFGVLKDLRASGYVISL